MKNFLALTILILACSAANAQARGDTCVNCGDRPNNQQINAQDQRASEIAAHNQWPGRPEVAKSASRTHTLFITNFQLNNDSDKEIREIKWTATLTNRETREEIGTFPFQTKKKISPHKTVTLKERLAVPLKKLHGQVVSATQPTDPNKPVPVDEKYQVVEIVYADKSVFKP
jgi:hypothetical protein